MGATGALPTPHHRAAGLGSGIVAGAILAVVVAVALCAGAHADENEASLPTQPLVEGSKVFTEKGCDRCHGIPGTTGKERIGPDLGRQRSWRDMMQLAGSLWNHSPTMIEKMHEQHIQRPTLSPNEMGSLAAYLFSLNFVDEPGDATRGRELFEQRSCARCHQLGGHGGTAGPRLDELKAYASTLFLAQALWNHGTEMAAKMAELHLGRPRLESDDVAHIVAFIRGDAQTPAPLEVGSPRAGKALFREKGCIKCHTIAGAGGAVGPDLGKRRPTQHLAQMAGALWNHGPPMWAKMKEFGVQFPKLTGREMSDILAYLYFVQYMGDTGDATRGSEVFREKTCSRCHAAGAEGLKTGPDLAASAALRSPPQWASAMWNHAPAIEKIMRETYAPWPRFEDDEMRDLVEFLRSRSGGK